MSFRRRSSESTPLIPKKQSITPLINVGLIVFTICISCALIAVSIAFGVTWNQRQPKPNARFAVIGDTNYGSGANLTVNVALNNLNLLIDQLNAQDLDFVVHIGDIHGGTIEDCSEFGMQRSANLFTRLRHPMIYTPGDNEWVDCANYYPSDVPTWSDYFYPPHALSVVRNIMFNQKIDTQGRLHAFGPGGANFILQSQKDDPDFSEFVENTFWHFGDSTFCTIHIHGGECVSCTYGGNTTLGNTMREERDRRFAASLKWLDTCFNAAVQRGSSHMLLFSQTPLQSNFQTPVSFKLTDTTRNNSASMLQSLRAPIELRTSIIEKIQARTLAFGNVHRVEPQEYAAYLAYYLSFGYSQEDIDTFLFGAMFKNFEVKAGGNPVHFFSGDVHVPVPGLQNMPQATAYDPDGWLAAGYSDLIVDNFKQHLVPGGAENTGFILCEIFSGTITPIHVMVAPFSHTPYSGIPIAPLGAKKKKTQKRMTLEEHEEMLMHLCKYRPMISPNCTKN